MRLPSILLLLVLGTLLASCRYHVVGASSNSERSIVFRAGTSFGECLGYCVTELSVDEESTVLTRKGWNIDDLLPDQVTRRATDPVLWNELTGLIDMRVLRGLDDVYGCPDCADGGAEWIEVETNGERKRVTFEYGTVVEPVRGLIEAARDVREAFAETD